MISRWIGIIKAMRELAKKNAPVRDQRPSTLLILTVWKKSLLADNWLDLIEGFDAISLKVADGSSSFQSSEAREMASGARSAGLLVHAWGFHRCESIGAARKEGEAAAKAALSVGAVAYHWNAEKQWANASNTQGTALAFAKAFRNRAPSLELYANCFNSPVNDAIVEAFDVLEPMCYGTKASTIAKKIDKRMTRPGIPKEKLAIMVGTGRLNGDVAGQAWGYHNEGDDGVPGLLKLALEHRPAAINYFRGGVAGGEDIMQSGNPINIRLSDQAQQIRAALDGAVV
jgi:hypothetical protein